MKEELTLEEQVERIRRKRRKIGDHEKLRTALNTIFMALALVGLVWYFSDSESHITALGIIAAGMLFKVAEFVVRFFF